MINYLIYKQNWHLLIKENESSDLEYIEFSQKIAKFLASVGGSHAGRARLPLVLPPSVGREGGIANPRRDGGPIIIIIIIKILSLLIRPSFRIFLVKCILFIQNLFR